ncbi:MAG: F420-0--gamma-glutamyl ligase [Clostridia bacterium]|jgi:F420-0:gamma-glutamyl ligase-like protein|nr:F420-0--gamma-glutamyl ligase [Clostridia bacterium]
MAKKRKRHPLVKIDSDYYLRIPIKTHLLTKEDDIVGVIAKYVSPAAKTGDLLFVSEKALAITQGRAILLKEIKPRFLAKLLSKYVKKVSYGIGLGMPETMEIAFREVGVLRILFAAFVGAIGKLLGRSGDFYRIAGRRVAMIDGPTPYTIPPYNQYVVPAPLHPERIANEVEDKLGISCAIVDVNDIGREVIALSPKSPLPVESIVAVLRDNPLGQGSQQTPMGLIRPMSPEEAQEILEVASAEEG